jgi:hypothetical protein
MPAPRSVAVLASQIKEDTMLYCVLFVIVLISSGAACGGVPDEGNHSSAADQARFARKFAADSNPNEVSVPYRSIEHERAVLRKRVIEHYQQGKLSFEDYMRFSEEIEALDNWEVAREQAWINRPSQTGDLADDSNEAGLPLQRRMLRTRLLANCFSS